MYLIIESIILLFSRRYYTFAKKFLACPSLVYSNQKVINCLASCKLYLEEMKKVCIHFCTLLDANFNRCFKIFITIKLQLQFEKVIKFRIFCKNVILKIEGNCIKILLSKHIFAMQAFPDSEISFRFYHLLFQSIILHI